MKIKGLIVVSVCAALILGSCAKSSIKSAKVNSQMDSLAYAIGMDVYNTLQRDSIKLDPVIFAKAMQDGMSGKTLMDLETAKTFIYTYFNAKEQEKIKLQYKDILEQGNAFLAKNKERPGVIVTASGLQYEVIKMGTGEKPTESSTVKVHYTGTLIDGTKFDSSVDRNEPASFPVTGVIKGWTEALQLMPVGSKFRIYLPESLAYGASGNGEVIKPYSTLLFDVELLEIVK